MAVPRAARKLHGRAGQQVLERHHRLSENVAIRLLHRFLSGNPVLRPTRGAAAVEERFTTTRMAKDYVGVYRRLVKTHTAGAKPHRADLNGGNGSTPMSIERSLPALFEAGANPEVPL
jgi:hypothetical protein